ncbi:hypothetical protein Memar_0900 [Methanoculleus marisnigri JR1]|uniref:Uncharacterized protein n=1 Tax=Methanoculleus marisnigri (strain ATCC 35101 / DSM 1498 / JR1) TaxID=368407 RepID=A3CTY3_METMJ|nr:hypothetical protein Memar_0900 [Methanoculleus marisnigri JR1]
MSKTITLVSEYWGPRQDPDACRKESSDENGDLVLFEALVREYCGIGFFECLVSPENDYLTSAVWEESGGRPPALLCAVVELLHRAVERADER